MTADSIPNATSTSRMSVLRMSHKPPVRKPSGPSPSTQAPYVDMCRNVIPFQCGSLSPSLIVPVPSKSLGARRKWPAPHLALDLLALLLLLQSHAETPRWRGPLSAHRLPYSQRLHSRNQPAHLLVRRRREQLEPLLDRLFTADASQYTPNHVTSNTYFLTGS